MTLWQDFIGATFLASLAADAAGAATGEGVRHFSLDLHSAAATSKPSPYLPVCVIAAKSPTPSGQEAAETEEGLGAGCVKAWCDRAGRPLAVGQEPVVLHGQNEVRIPRRKRGGKERGRHVASFACAWAVLCIHGGAADVERCHTEALSRQSSTHVG